MNKVFELSLKGAVFTLSSFVLIACDSGENKIEQKGQSKELEQAAPPKLQDKVVVEQKKMTKSVVINGEKYLYSAAMIKPGVYVTHAASQTKVKVTERIAVVMANKQALALATAKTQLEKLGTMKTLTEGVFELSFNADTDMLEQYNAIQALPFVKSAELQLWHDPKAQGKATY
ncbi:hypothetical protein [Alteromonas sp. a30]|uniref:hypothetical protein n=1 Tax=Alteromonas sp. a30 TaxID=2730917 RepID=UPI0022824AF3|nr:hypothetical protein [Alteromonas sp. a30]MCY7294132.1 hypothetical protein [Alteromonas sp. a30]